MTAAPIDLRSARRFFGRLRPTQRCAGQRFEGGADGLIDALRIAGRAVAAQPIENGWPPAKAICIVRTWGSNWVDILPERQQRALDDELLIILTAQSEARAFSYDYDPVAGHWSHRLYRSGRVLDALDHDASAASDDGVDGRVETLLRSLRIRDWGIDADDLCRLDVPFPATAIVEAWFLQLGTQGSS
ncbi:hypothetical protein [Bradyrhizobium sp. SZCCHNS3051]|uniref:hypothetical protein n=1 Tax=Bradyrhizobium sp. SZCCHNS3051 TaxID=3057320 RepID=UPI002916B6D5|nr:hypothetical protein [Bradyrhizobium sp. SZCCHNS3051]